MTDTVGEKICSNERVYTNISDETRQRHVLKNRRVRVDIKNIHFYQKE